VSDDPREALLAVAREIIAKRGYLGLSMRTASAAAGVTEDVALRYYRNREALFAAAMRLPVDPVSAIPALMAPGIEGMGERLVRFTLDTLRDPAARDDLISLARTGVSAGQAVTGLQDFIETGVVDRVAGMIGVPDARMRSALITSYLMGVATMRYGVRLEPLASASDEEVIRMVAPVIQDLLDPRRPIPGSARARARSSAPVTRAGQAPPPGSRTRTFDPDPAATRAAEAARLVAELARTTPTGVPAAPRSGSVPTTKAAPKEAAAKKATPKGATPRKASTKKATATKAPTTKGTTTKAPTTKAPTTKGTTKQTTATKTTATKATPTKRAASAPAPGPKHAQVSPEPAPTSDPTP
jgi:AcrR family transcriptional regulator